MKKIPESELRRAEREASAPVKKTGPKTAEIFAVIGDIKAAQRLHKDHRPALDRLAAIVAEATAAGDYEALGDVAKAWGKVEAAGAEMSVTSGKNSWELIQGFIKNPPRAPITLTLIQAMRNFQGRSNRAPNRQELLSAISAIHAEGIDETELSRQLKRLGWADLLS